MPTELHLFPEVVLVGPRFEERRDAAVIVKDGVIADITDAAPLRERGSAAETIDLPGQALMAGFVNAHQHGRGVTQFQLGFADDVLETWISGLRASGVLEPYAQTMIACLDMIAAGVTTAIHANTAYGSGDPLSDMRGTMRAYADSGLRAVAGMGLWDRAGSVYPAEREPAFLATLPDGLAERMAARRRASFFSDAGEAARAIRILREEHDTSRVKAAYAPAGPQWVSDALMAAALRDAAELGCVVHMHVLESWMQYLTLREVYPEGVLGRFAKLGPVDARLSFGHAVWLGARDADLAAERGVTMVRNAGSNLRLKCGAMPLAEYRRRGVRVAIGTDSMTLHEDEDILQETRLAGRLARVPQWDAAPPPSPTDLLGALTRGGAQAANLGEKAGELAAGAPADLVAIDITRTRGTYLAAATPVADQIYYRAGQGDVRMTMVAGDILYRDGRHTKHDYAATAARAAADIARAASLVRNAERDDIATFVAHIERHYSAYAHEREQAGGPWEPLARR